MRVLLVEPDRILAASYRACLTAVGYTVDHAVSAQGAVQCADANHPDVVILEMQLPHHNGVEFLYEFRSYREWEDIPVIILSLVPSAELQRAATLTTELGVVRILYKPETSLAQLQAAVSTHAAQVA